MSDPSFTYSVFGLVLESSLELPELPAATGTPDVRIAVGDVPPPIEDPVDDGVLYQASPGVLRLVVPNVATFLAVAGSEVTVAPHPSATTADVRLFLYGSVLGAILQQRGVLTIHASAVTDGDHAVLFAGQSGRGKSTLAASFARNGHRLLSDDVVAIRSDAERGAMAFSAYPQIKLWADALDRMDIDSSGLERVRSQLEKSYVPMSDRFADGSVPVRHVFVLNMHNEDDIVLRPVTGRAKLSFLIGNTYRRQFLDGLGGKEAHFNGCVTLSRTASLTAVLRPRDGFRVDELRARIVDHLAELSPAS